MAKVNMTQLQDEPRTGKFRMGYSVNGVEIYATYPLAPREEVCRTCDGSGQQDFDDGVDGFSKPYSRRCEACNGNGSIINEPDEGEE